MLGAEPEKKLLKIGVGAYEDLRHDYDERIQTSVSPAAAMPCCDRGRAHRPRG